MDNWIDTFRGVIYPWHCDHLGHMNVQHYVGMFDQAGYHLMHAFGFSHDYSVESGHAPIDVEHRIKYKHEQRAGSMVTITSGIVEVGTKTYNGFHRMTNTESGVLAATMEVVWLNVDLATRKAAEISPEVRDKLSAHLVERE
jgi:acyl-CoA thioester hydrolase